MAAASSSVAYCPACHHASHSLHSRYSRVLRDLPWQGSPVELRLHVRRFRCRARDCPRVTFSEMLPTVSPRYGRQTCRLSETIRLIGYVLGGEAGARLPERLGVRTSPDTVLRKLKFGPFVSIQGARAVGVDDWPWRKGQRYGTILVDMESHAPIDLLPERSADSLAAWLQSHPGAEVISRDRAGLYADGATRGAPEAIQVADRFHLMCNLTAAVERVLEQKRSALAAAVVPVPREPPPPQPDSPSKAKTRTAQVREDRRQRRVDRYDEVVGLYRKGMSQQAISGMLHMGRKTIRRFLRAGQFPERAMPHRRPSDVNRFRDFLQRRWDEGCHNATELWHEIQAQGYAGGRSTMARFVCTLRTQGTKYFRKTVAPRQPKAKPPSPRQAAMLLARRPEKLKLSEQQLLAKLNQCCPEIPILYGLTQGFARPQLAPGTASPIPPCSPRTPHDPESFALFRNSGILLPTSGSCCARPRTAFVRMSCGCSGRCGARRRRYGAHSLLPFLARVYRRTIRSAKYARQDLAGTGVGGDELAVGRRPDSMQALASADEERGRSQCHKCHKQGIFNKILTLVLSQKVSYGFQHDFPQFSSVSGVTRPVQGCQRL
jgi:transposase